MPDCLNCTAEGRRREATHRMVLRGKVEPNQWGVDQYIHVDCPDVLACQEHVDAFMRSAPSPRDSIRIIGKLQQKAISEGKIFPGAIFNYGFADLGKPLFVAVHEMVEQLDRKPTQVIEGQPDRGEHEAELAKKAKAVRAATTEAFAALQAQIPEAQLQFDHAGMQGRIVIVRRGNDGKEYTRAFVLKWGEALTSERAGEIQTAAAAIMAKWPAARERRNAR